MDYLDDDEDDGFRGPPITIWTRLRWHLWERPRIAIATRMRRRKEMQGVPTRLHVIEAQQRSLAANLGIIARRQEQVYTTLSDVLLVLSKDQKPELALWVKYALSRTDDGWCDFVDAVSKETGLSGDDIAKIAFGVSEKE